MSIVLDASVALSWHFKDQTEDVVHDLLARVAADGATVPGHWELEMANGLLRGERVGKTTPEQVGRFIVQLMTLDLLIEPIQRGAGFAELLPLSRQYGLKIMDAGYLTLARDRGLPLATFDARLAGACRALDIATLGHSRWNA